MMEGEGLYGAHEGYAAYVTADGRLTGTSSARGVDVWEPGQEPMTEDTLVPWSQVVAWQTRCECGWIGSRWERAATTRIEYDGYDYGDDDDARHAEDARLPDGTRVEDAARAEWRAHVDPLVAAAPPPGLADQLTAVLDDVDALTEKRPLAALALLRVAAARADRATHTAAGAARAAGTTWEEIGTALGVSRQAAAERFTRTRTGERTTLR